MPLNYCYRRSQNRPRQVCPFAVPMVTTTTPPVPSPLEHVPASNRLLPPFDPEKKAKSHANPLLFLQNTLPFQCFSQTPHHAHVVPEIPSPATRSSCLSMPRPFPAGFAVFRPFRRRVAAWDVAVSMAFAAPAWFPPDANVAEPRFRQSPRLQPPMAVSLTRENRPKGERPKSAHQPWSKMGCPHQMVGNRTPPTRTESLRRRL